MYYGIPLQVVSVAHRIWVARCCRLFRLVPTWAVDLPRVWLEPLAVVPEADCMVARAWPRTTLPPRTIRIRIPADIRTTTTTL